MIRKAIALTGAALLAACASQPPPPPPVAAPEPPPPPVVITEPMVAEPIVEAIPPVPEAPPRPQQTDAGRFRIGVASLESAELAARWVGKVEAAGYRSEVLPVQIEGKTWHRVLAPGYANLVEAQAAIPFIEQDLGIQGAWVTSRRRAPTPDAAAGAATAPAETSLPEQPQN
jgi:cell division septation protein DedD